MSDVIATPEGVRKLANDIWEGCNSLHDSAVRVKEGCDQLGITFKDSGYQKVYETTEVAINGFKKNKDNLQVTVETLIRYAEYLEAARQQV